MRLVGVTYGERYYNLHDLLKVRVDGEKPGEKRFMTIKVTRVFSPEGEVKYFYYFEDQQLSNIFVRYVRSDAPNKNFLEWNPLTDEIRMVDEAPEKSKHYMYYFFIAETMFPSSPVAAVMGIKKIEQNGEEEEEEKSEEDE
ncbi:MAG: hypothetical protein ACXQS8_06670 [Candidatus Helarchaeales archaeon]